MGGIPVKRAGLCSFDPPGSGDFENGFPVVAAASEFPAVEVGFEGNGPVMKRRVVEVFEEVETVGNVDELVGLDGEDLVFSCGDVIDEEGRFAGTAVPVRIGKTRFTGFCGFGRKGGGVFAGGDAVTESDLVGGIVDVTEKGGQLGDGIGLGKVIDNESVGGGCISRNHGVRNGFGVRCSGSVLTGSPGADEVGGGKGEMDDVVPGKIFFGEVVGQIESAHLGLDGVGHAPGSTFEGFVDELHELIKGHAVAVVAYGREAGVDVSEAGVAPFLECAGGVGVGAVGGYCSHAGWGKSSIGFGGFRFCANGVRSH